MPLDDADLGTVANPVPQDFIWYEQDATGKRTWYTNRNGGSKIGADFDPSLYVPKTGGTFTGDVLLPSHASFEGIPTNAAISKEDLLSHELQVYTVTEVPQNPRHNSLFLITE